MSRPAAPTASPREHPNGITDARRAAAAGPASRADEATDDRHLSLSLTDASTR